MNNFGYIKNVFNSLLSENFKNKNNKKLFSKYIKLLNNNKVLKEQFKIYNLIENKFEPNKQLANTYINDLFNNININKKNIISENNKLFNILLEDSQIDYDIAVLKPYAQKAYDLFTSNFEDAQVYDNNKFKFNNEEDINKFKQNLLDIGIPEVFILSNELEYVNELYKHINNILINKGNINKLDSVLESKEYISEYITNNSKTESNISGLNMDNKSLSSVLLTKFKNSYSNLSESEFKFIKSTLTNDLNEQISIYNEYKNKVLNLINNKLKESESDVKEKLLSVKEKLLNEEYEKDVYFNNTIKLINLEKTLL